MLELESDAAVGPHVSAVLVEGVADIGDGPRFIIGEAVDHDGRATNAVTFITDFNVIDAF